MKRWRAHRNWIIKRNRNKHNNSFTGFKFISTYLCGQHIFLAFIRKYRVNFDLTYILETVKYQSHKMVKNTFFTIMHEMVNQAPVQRSQ